MRWLVGPSTVAEVMRWHNAGTVQLPMLLCLSFPHRDPHARPIAASLLLHFVYIAGGR